MISEKFGKEFFNGDKKIPGTYGSYGYRYEQLYPKFLVLAKTIQSLFNPKRILDIGCAKGFLVKAFRDIGIEAYGVDISKYCLSTAPKDVKGYLIRSDLESSKLPFHDDSFDFVTLLVTIEYINNTENVLLETSRVVKSGGYLLLKTLIKEDAKDEFRINIHPKIFWINKFADYNFIYTDNYTSLLEEELVRTHMEDKVLIRNLRKPIAKLLLPLIRRRKIRYLLFKKR